MTSKKLSDWTFVAFDTETTGGYPVGSEIVEFGAVKWQGGQEVGRLEFLFKPSEPMADFIIGIHGITNEMVSQADKIEKHIKTIHDFFRDSIVVAHHAPFDMGFLAYDFEKYGLDLNFPQALCTSLLARKWIRGSINHKLQTLISFLKLDQGQAHRALDDAKACLGVLFKCFDQMGWDKSLEDAYKSQGKNLNWANYSLLGSANAQGKELIKALQQKKDVDMVYASGRSQGKVQRLKPLGIVRNPDGDYLSAICYSDNTKKRYYLNRINDVLMVY
ncbi:MAG: exonuclease domain-containing protein [Pseudobdellovibrionaceae bacterium]